MKGLHLEQGLEVRLEVTGDEFVQGDTVPCRLTLKNRGVDTRTISTAYLKLALGTIKKVRAKDSGAFSVLEIAPLNPGEVLASGEEVSLDASFILSKNAAVSDKNQTLYLLYGVSDGATGDFSAGGQLPLTVKPHQHIQEISNTLEMVFQFVPKGVTWKNGQTTAKLKPPTSRRFATLDELNLASAFDLTDTRENPPLVLTYRFTVKKFESTVAKGDIKKAKTELEVRLEPDQYLFGGGFFNQEFIERSIDQALGEVSSGI